MFALPFCFLLVPGGLGMWSAAGDRLFGMCGAQTAPLLPLSLPLASAVNKIARALHSSLGLGSLLERHLYRAPLGSRTSGLGVVWASLGSCSSILKSRSPGEYSNIFKKKLGRSGLSRSEAPYGAPIGETEIICVCEGERAW